jgi:hypothetical protein
MTLDIAADTAGATQTSRSIRVVTLAVLSAMVAGVLLATRWAVVSDAGVASAVAVVVWGYTLLSAVPLVVVMRRLDHGVTGVDVEPSQGTGATIYPFPTLHAKVS